ncbi:hypothetical protein WA158_004946 [Blastocystis sp. Blastoise]
MESIVTEIRKRLNIHYMPKWSELPGLEIQGKRLREILEQTFVYGNNEIVVMSGPEGTGKKFLLHHVLNNLQIEYSDKEENPFDVNNYISVWLDGSYLDDDNSAFRSITRQLSDTEIMRDKRIRSNQRNNLEFAALCGYPLLIVLDDFPSFCDRKKQTLLYSLMDLCGQPNVKITVVCINNEPSSIQKFEKRITSRFSQKQIICIPPTFNSIYTYFQKIMVLKPSEIDSDVLPSLSNLTQYNTYMENLIKNKTISNYLEQLLSTSVIPITISILIIYILLFLNNICTLQRILLFSLEQVSSYTSILYTYEDIQRGYNRFLDSINSLYNCITYLGLYELCLLIAIKKRTEKTDEKFNFIHIYTDFLTWVRKEQKKLSIKEIDVDTAWKCFEKLLNYQLVQFTPSSHGLGNKNDIPYNIYISLNVTPYYINEMIKSNKLQCPTEISYWALQWEEI